jgi:hypothetical protein
MHEITEMPWAGGMGLRLHWSRLLPAGMQNQMYPPLALGAVQDWSQPMKYVTKILVLFCIACFRLQGYCIAPTVCFYLACAMCLHLLETTLEGTCHSVDAADITHICECQNTPAEI